MADQPTRSFARSSVVLSEPPELVRQTPSVRPKYPFSESLSASKVIEELYKANYNRLLSPRAPAKKAMLTLSWERSDTTGAHDSNTIATLMKDVFGFETELYPIPAGSVENSLGFTISKIHEFKAKHDRAGPYAPRSLLILHYAGHGLSDRGLLLSGTAGADRNPSAGSDRKLLVSGTASFEHYFRFETLKNAMLERCRGDVLFILDCCNAAGATRLQDGPRTVEILAACGETEVVTDEMYKTFTAHFDRIARALPIYKPVTIESIRDAILTTDYNPVPFFSRSEGTRPITLKPIQRPPGPASTFSSPRLSQALSKDIPPDWVIVLVHVKERSESKEMRELEVEIGNIQVRRGYHGKVICKIPVHDGCVLSFALPAPIYQWLEDDPSFVAVGRVPDSFKLETDREAESTSQTEAQSERNETFYCSVVRLYQLAEERAISKDYAGARISFLEVLERLEKESIQQNISIGILEKIADLDEALGDMDKAISRLEDAVNISTTYYGEKHEETEQISAALRKLKRRNFGSPPRFVPSPSDNPLRSRSY